MPKTAHRSDSSCQKQTRDLAVARSSRSSSKLKLKRNDAPKKAGHSRKTYSRLLWIPSCLLLTPVAPARNPFSSPLSSPLVNERRLPSLVHTFYATTASTPTFPSPSHPVALCPAPPAFSRTLNSYGPVLFHLLTLPLLSLFHGSTKTTIWSTLRILRSSVKLLLLFLPRRLLRCEGVTRPQHC